MLQLNLLLALAWLALTGQFTPVNFAFGFGISFLLLYLLRRGLGAGWQAERYFRKVVLVVEFILFFAREVVIANLKVMVEVLRPRPAMRPGIVAVPLEAHSPLGLTLLANMITLTPGTLSLEVSPDRRVLYVHAFNVGDVEAFRRTIKQDYERRVLEVLA